MSEINNEVGDLPWDSSVVLPDVTPCSYWQYAPIETLLPAERLAVAGPSFKKYEFLETPVFSFLKPLH